MTWPALGASAPLRRLTNVVLPAPLGPISAWRAPASSWKSTSRVTISAPKLRLRPRVSRSGVVTCRPLGLEEQEVRDVAEVVGVQRPERRATRQGARGHAEVEFTETGARHRAIEL